MYFFGIQVDSPITGGGGGGGHISGEAYKRQFTVLQKISKQEAMCSLYSCRIKVDDYLYCYIMVISVLTQVSLLLEIQQQLSLCIKWKLGKNQSSRWDFNPRPSVI